MINVDSVEGVSQGVSDYGVDLFGEVERVAVDNVCCAIRAEVRFVFGEGSSGDDRAEAGKGADLDCVFTAVAPCANDDDGFFAIVE